MLSMEKSLCLLYSKLISWSQKGSLKLSLFFFFLVSHNKQTKLHPVSACLQWQCFSPGLSSSTIFKANSQFLHLHPNPENSILLGIAMPSAPQLPAMVLQGEDMVRHGDLVA